MNPYLSVIIPAFNEEARIGQTLEAVTEYLTARPFTWELLVVLDGSQDGTLAVVEGFAAGCDRVRWLARKENRGKGFTVRQGMLAAHGEVRLFTDADNSTDMSHFDQMLPQFADGYEVVICSRDGKDAAGARQAVPQRFHKRFLGNAANLLIQIVAVPGIWDTQCGFKAFTAGASEAIFARATIDRWGFDVEALAVARRLDYEIAIVPAYWVNKEGTHVRPLDYFRTLADTFRTRWNLMTGVYDRVPQPLADKAPN